LYIKINLLYS